MLKITIVTPVKNGERFIRETVESVLSQRGDFTLEYLIRDGASTDGTLAALAPYRDRCQIISERDGSPQAAINAGMRQATGDILAWLNADDVYEPGALQAVATAFTRHPQRQWAYGRCSVMDETGQEIRRGVTWYKNTLGYVYTRQMLLCENFINQPATFWRRELWTTVGELDTSYKAAWDYLQWLRMAAVAPALHIRQQLARFRRHPGSISENFLTRQFDEDLAIARLHGQWPHVLLHRINRYKILWAYRLMTPRPAGK